MTIVDGDGHVWEDPVGISRFVPDMYKAKGPLPLAEMFPPLDYFHFQIGETQPGAFSKPGLEGWQRFMDEVGISQAVVYPSVALSIGRIPFPDWAIVITR